MGRKNSIAVYCASAMGHDPVYREEAEKLAQLLADQGRKLVYGSGNLGLMGVVSQLAREKGCRTEGVNITRFHRDEFVPMSDEYVLFPTLAERKREMLSRCDASIALPGGTGTLDELTEVLVQLQIGGTDKPIGLLNVNGFYDPLVQLFDNMLNAGFLKQKDRDHLIVHSDAKALLQALDEA